MGVFAGKSGAHRIQKRTLGALELQLRWVSVTQSGGGEMRWGPLQEHCVL